MAEVTVSWDEGRREESNAGVSGLDSYDPMLLWLIIVAGVVAALRMGSDEVEATAFAFLGSCGAFAELGRLARSYASEPCFPIASQ